MSESTAMAVAHRALARIANGEGLPQQVARLALRELCSNNMTESQRASQKMARLQVAIENAILLMDAEYLSAAAEYNGLWAALADFVGVDEIEYRQAFWQVDEKGRQHRNNPLRSCKGNHRSAHTKQGDK